MQDWKLCYPDQYIYVNLLLNDEKTEFVTVNTSTTDKLKDMVI